MKTQRIGNRMKAIKTAVEAAPGCTAHALANLAYVGTLGRPRWSYVYSAFARARRAGLISAVSANGRTVYFPSVASRVGATQGEFLNAMAGR